MDRRGKSLNLIHGWAQAKMVCCSTTDLPLGGPEKRHRCSHPGGQSFGRCVWHPNSVKRDLDIRLYMDTGSGGWLVGYR